MKTKRRKKQAGQPFHLLCKPIGARCNLRCAHCFYLEKSNLYPGETNWSMSDEVLERFVKFYLETQAEGVGEVQFAWQGGEPTLMGVDFFRRAVALQRQHAKPGLRISNALQTNGTLLDDEWGKFLHDEQFLVGISLDGPEALHNRFRPHPDGRGSFADAMRGLAALRRHEVEYNTLTCVQADNADHPGRVYDFLKNECGSRFMQFIPIIEPGEGGGVSPQTATGEQWGRFMCGIFDEWLKGDVGEIYVQHFDVLLGLVLGRPAALCVYSPVCGRALVVEHNGDVYACDHFVTEQHKRGNLLVDSPLWLIDGEKQAEFGREKSARLPRYCRECEYLRLCYGGCPSDRLSQTPDGEPGLNSVCAGYKMMFAHLTPVLEAMGRALRKGRPAKEWLNYR